MRRIIITGVMTLLGLNTLAQNGTVKSFTKISAAPNSLGNLPTINFLGQGMCLLKDMDGDGVPEMAVRSTGIPANSGYVCIFRLNSNGTVKSGFTRLGNNTGGINIPSTSFSQFGWSIANMGDLDGNGLDDIVVGSGSNQFILIVYLNAGGTADSFKRITYGENGFNDPLTPGGAFGRSVANIGDLDKDGVRDLAVGDDADQNRRGAVRILFMNADHTVKSVQKIAHNQGGFISLNPDDYFGNGISSLGDLDKDGNVDILVGAPGGGTGPGKAYTIFLNADGTVKTHYTYEPGTVSFPDTTQPVDWFGGSTCNIGDLDGDSVTDVAISDANFDSLGKDKGRVWIMFLNQDGSAKSFQKIGEYLGGFTASIDSFDGFGTGMCPLGDFNGDGIFDFCVAAVGDDDGDPSNSIRESGALYFLYLNGVPQPDNVKEVKHVKHFSLYPNPSQDQLTIKSSTTERISKVELIDMSGRHIITAVYQAKEFVMIDVSKIPNGTYAVLVNHRESGQFVKF